MKKADPEKDVTRNTHNYFAHGGNELVIGGKLTFLPGAIIEFLRRCCVGFRVKLTFLPGAIIEGGDDLFGQSEPAAQIAYIANSEATTIAALKDDFNGLLAAIRNAGLMVSSK